MLLRIFLTVSLLGLVSSAADIALVSKGFYFAGAGNTTEIASYDPGTKRVFSVNGLLGRLDIIDISNPATPTLVTSVNTDGFPNSVAVRDGIVAVAVEAAVRQNPGKVKFYDVNGTLLNDVPVGAVPDMLTFTPNGRRVLVANEGEPSGYRTTDVDPEGSVSIIDMTGGVGNLSADSVRTARFTTYIPQTNPESIRIYGPGATIAQDMEPEYISPSHDSKTAWVTLQENNAIAILDVEAGEFTSLIGLGFKNHNSAANALDPSDRDGGININAWPVLGIYEPDSIDSYRVGGRTYLVMGNEGDTRDYPGFNEESRVSSLALDATAFPDASTLKQDANLGRLTVTNTLGNPDGDTDYDALYVPGARSFSIRDENGALIWDSGKQFETITAAAVPASFNSNGDVATFDTRSDNKGPEPEGVVVGKCYGRDYAFIGLERTGGVLVYDISNPTAPEFVQYINLAPADLAPEGVFFIKADDSPTGNPLLVVSHEISGTLRIFEVQRQ